MNTLKKLFYFFGKKSSLTAPLLIIIKDVNNPVGYSLIEEAIADPESEPNASIDKIDQLKQSLKQLKNKTSIKIRNGEIIH